MVEQTSMNFYISIPPFSPWPWQSLDKPVASLSQLHLTLCHHSCPLQHLNHPHPSSPSQNPHVLYAKFECIELLVQYIIYHPQQQTATMQTPAITWLFSVIFSSHPFHVLAMQINSTATNHDHFHHQWLQIVDYLVANTLHHLTPTPYPMTDMCHLTT